MSMSYADRWRSPYPDHVAVPVDFRRIARKDGLTQTAVNLLIELHTFWLSEGERPYPSLAVLAARCGTSVSAIQNARKNATERGWLAVEKTIDDDGKEACAYDLRPCRAKWAALASPKPLRSKRDLRRAGPTLELADKDARIAELERQLADPMPPEAGALGAYLESLETQKPNSDSLVDTGDVPHIEKAAWLEAFAHMHAAMEDEGSA